MKKNIYPYLFSGNRYPSLKYWSCHLIGLTNCKLYLILSFLQISTNLNLAKYINIEKQNKKEEADGYSVVTISSIIIYLSYLVISIYMTDQHVTKISEIMTKKIETVGSTSTAQDAAIKMKEKQVSSIVVIDDKDGNPQGIITERDLAIKVSVSDKSSKEIPSNQVMSSPLITISADSSPSEAASLMIKNKVRHLLVVATDNNQNTNNGVGEERGSIKPIGIITPMDFTRFEVIATSDQDKDNNISRILDYYRGDFDFFP